MVAANFAGRKGIEFPAGALVFDRQGLMAQVDGDTALLREIIDIFLWESDATMRRLGDAVADRDGRKLYFEAHGLKGALGSLHACRACFAAKHLEEIARAGRWSEVDTTLGTLIVEMARLRSVLRGSAGQCVSAPVQRFQTAAA